MQTFSRLVWNMRINYHIRSRRPVDHILNRKKPHSHSLFS